MAKGGPGATETAIGDGFGVRSAAGSTSLSYPRGTFWRAGATAAGPVIAPGRPWAAPAACRRGRYPHPPTPRRPRLSTIVKKPAGVNLPDPQEVSE